MWLRLSAALFILAIVSCDETISEEGTGEPESVEDPAIDFPSDNGVYVLSESNFDDFVAEHSFALIEFYAPWCGHCKSLAPEYEKAAAMLKKKDPKVVLAKVDATVEKELGKKYDVSGYPTLKFWNQGDPNEYDGPRTADGIVNWLMEKTDPNYTPPEETVITVTKDNFDDVVKTADIILVEFYAPWCGHCKSLAPEYEAAAKRLALLEDPIPLAKIDATQESELAKEYGVSGYPTLKIFRKGRRFDYNGPRQADGIVDYMKKQAEPAAIKIEDHEQAMKFFSKEDITIIGFFATDQGKDFENFMDAADKMREDFPAIGYSLDPAVMKHFKVKPGEIGLYQPERYFSKFEPRDKVFRKDGASTEDIVAWWNENVLSMVGQRTHGNEKRYSKLPMVVVYYTVDFSFHARKGTQYWRTKVLRVARDYPKFTWAISDEEEYATEMTSIGLGTSGQDVNVAVFGKDGKKYPWDPDHYDDFGEDTLREFMEDISRGKVKPHMKSQPAPKDDKGPVKTVVASNFDKVVLDESKDVFIEFYAPWCGHCKQLEPIYKDLAKKLKHEKNLVIAKIDQTANDSVDKFSVDGFPTIYFAPKGRKDDPIKYTGGRTLEEMEKFIKENAIASFQGKSEL